MVTYLCVIAGVAMVTGSLRHATREERRGIRVKVKISRVLQHERDIIYVTVNINMWCAKISLPPTESLPSRVVM